LKKLTKNRRNSKVQIISRNLDGKEVKEINRSFIIPTTKKINPLNKSFDSKRNF